jgi:hypothetical protein
MRFSSVWIFGVSLLVFATPSVRAQSSSAEQPATLVDLLTEADKNNPHIQAARHGWQSAKQIPTQVATLPDPVAGELLSLRPLGCNNVARPLFMLFISKAL